MFTLQHLPALYFFHFAKTHRGPQTLSLLSSTNDQLNGETRDWSLAASKPSPNSVNGMHAGEHDIITIGLRGDFADISVTKFSYSTVVTSCVNREIKEAWMCWRYVSPTEHTNSEKDEQTEKPHQFNETSPRTLSDKNIDGLRDVFDLMGMDIRQISWTNNQAHQQCKQCDVLCPLIADLIWSGSKRAVLTVVREIHRYHGWESEPKLKGVFEDIYRDENLDVDIIHSVIVFHSVHCSDWYKYAYKYESVHFVSIESQWSNPLSSFSGLFNIVQSLITSLSSGPDVFMTRRGSLKSKKKRKPWTSKAWNIAWVNVWCWSQNNVKGE